MNLTMTVKMILMLFLLFSGYSHFTFASNRLRVFRIGNESEFSVSLGECKGLNESLVTLFDEEDANFTEKLVKDTSGNAWLGLHKSRIPTWSDGAPVIFSDSSVNVANREQICEAIDNSMWTGFDCSERKYFMCYNGINYTLIEQNKTWCQAMQYCRKINTDLVSISSERQNEIVIEKGKNTSFWIGLLHDEWKWMDGSCSSFRKWSDENNMGKDCTQVNCRINITKKALLYQDGCGNSRYSFCSKGTMRIRVIHHKLMWEQAYDYCKDHHTGLLWIEDEEDQKAVEQWLKYTDVSGPFWIGLRQSRIFGFWIWSDRTVGYSNWKNNSAPEMPMSNNCGAINKPDYKWSDENCWVPHHFLCEEEIIYMNKSAGG